MHVQTNAGVDSCELLQSYWNADSSSLTVAGPSCHADSPLCYGVQSRLPLSVVPRQLSVSSFVQPTLFLRPVTTSGHAEISIPKPFVWFRAKTDKGIVCLAGHLHSVTGTIHFKLSKYQHQCKKKMIKMKIKLIFQTVVNFCNEICSICFNINQNVLYTKMIDFNGMSSHLGLFYAYRLGKRIYLCIHYLSKVFGHPQKFYFLS